MRAADDAVCDDHGLDGMRFEEGDDSATLAPLHSGTFPNAKFVFL
jgi:hypothetical protein